MQMPADPRAGALRALLLLGAVMLVGLAARLYHIGWLPLWVDEGFSDWAARQSLWYLWNIFPTFEFNPPFYYVALKGWRALAGDSEGALRALSALFGVATLPLLYLGGRALGGAHARNVGLFAALLFALAPLQVRYGQEARTYAMLVFGVTLALAAALWLTTRPVAVHSAPARPPVTILATLALGLAWIMWAHNMGALAVIAIAVPLLYWWIAEMRRSARVLGALVLTGLAALVLILPNLLPLLGHAGRVQAGFWITRPDWARIAETLRNLYGAPTPEGTVILGVLVTLAGIGLGTLWRQGRRAAALLLVSVATLPVLLETVISYLAMPVFLERTLLYVAVPLYLAAALGLAQLAQPLRPALASTLVLLLALACGSHFAEFRKEPWNEITRYVGQELAPGQPAFYLNTSVAWGLQYYAPRQQARFRSVGVPEDWPEPAQSQPAADARPNLDRRRINVDDLARVRDIAAHHDKLALILRNAYLTDPDNLVEQALTETHPRVERRSFDGIAVLIFQRR
ncbi:dolichyl-phosphate-mannose-protein mannosyltransferase [Azoarcus olearius]|uniref:glycosyltransferase family 39 protein n=1 Tax=Azoarcus sp. (strain BH72) TaxID=418699 RepID=UPI0008060BB1|nr:glycosyltransferase family 39 protein [Azoarcus olearius]ANQ85537.1 dolichyl-phosphate-mannose-protein mannosyltransferase [Azoarcus olearius]